MQSARFPARFGRPMIIKTHIIKNTYHKEVKYGKEEKADAWRQ